MRHCSDSALTRPIPCAKCIGGYHRNSGENEQCCTQSSITLRFINIFCSEFHHSEVEIKSLLFHPGYVFPRRLYQFEKSSQQKGLFFSDILPKSDTWPQIAAHSRASSMSRCRPPISGAEDSMGVYAPVRAS